MDGVRVIDLTVHTDDCGCLFEIAARCPAYSTLENCAVQAIGLDGMRPRTAALVDYLRARQA